MITKDQFLASLSHETKVIKHLHSKITTPELFSYRPSKDMRTVLELLQYLTMCAVGPAKSLLADNWDVARSYREKAASLPASQIPKALDEQFEAMKSLMAEIDEGQFLTREVKFPWGGADKLGLALIDTSLKFISAYRMQLFIYLKSAGLSHLNTSNCWRAVDPQK